MSLPRLRPRSLVWRPGRWLFAVHPFFTWRPQLDRGVFSISVWWLWFEVARAYV